MIWVASDMGRVLGCDFEILIKLSQACWKMTNILNSIEFSSMEPFQDSFLIFSKNYVQNIFLEKNIFWMFMNFNLWWWCYRSSLRVNNHLISWRTHLSMNDVCLNLSNKKELLKLNFKNIELLMQSFGSNPNHYEVCRYENFFEIFFISTNLEDSIRRLLS